MDNKVINGNNKIRLVVKKGKYIKLNFPINNIQITAKKHNFHLQLFLDDVVRPQDDIVINVILFEKYKKSFKFDLRWGYYVDFYFPSKFIRNNRLVDILLTTSQESEYSFIGPESTCNDKSPVVAIDYSEAHGDTEKEYLELPPEEQNEILEIIPKHIRQIK